MVLVLPAAASFSAVARSLARIIADRVLSVELTDIETSTCMTHGLSNFVAGVGTKEFLYSPFSAM
jgi:hypothetical protein